MITRYIIYKDDTRPEINSEELLTVYKEETAKVICEALNAEDTYIYKTASYRYERNNFGITWCTHEMAEQLNKHEDKKCVETFNDADDKWNYSFNENDIVVFKDNIDWPEEFNVFIPSITVKSKDIIGKIGIVKKCWSDLHAFGRGSYCYCNIDFDGILVTLPAGYFVKFEKEDIGE